MKKLSLFLMTSKGYAVLKHIIDNKLDKHIENVIIGEDRNIENDYRLEIEELCKLNNLKYYFKNDFYNSDRQIGIALAISWRWLINSNVNELYVIHDSLLPKYRGFAPLVNQLINGDKLIGASLIRADSSYDTGNIILQKKISISYPIKIQDAIRYIEEVYSYLTYEFIKLLIEENDLIGREQNHNEATYSLWRDKKDYFINWNMSSEEILRFIHAVGYPYDGAKCYVNKLDLVKIKDAELYPDLDIVNRDVGKVILIDDNQPIVVCGKGLLKITSLSLNDTPDVPYKLKQFRSRFN